MPTSSSTETNCGPGHKEPTAVDVPRKYLGRVRGLLSYSTNEIEVFRRAATYVDKILKGTKPAELPVEQPTKFELVINLKTAKALNLTIPALVLMRADRVIK